MRANFLNITNTLDDICDLIYSELSTRTYLEVVDLMSVIENNLKEIKTSIKNNKGLE